MWLLDFSKAALEKLLPRVAKTWFMKSQTLPNEVRLSTDLISSVSLGVDDGSDSVWSLVLGGGVTYSALICIIFSRSKGFF